MAKTNKYASINFNHIIEKNLSSSSSSSPSSSSSTSSNRPGKPHQSPPSPFASYSSISSLNTNPHARSHGRMLVLTRPTPKPVAPTAPQLSPSPSPKSQTPTHRVGDQPRSDPDSDQISLRPQGRTGVGIAALPARSPEPEKEAALPKPDKFVPPHLRPGFVSRGEKPGPEVFRPIQRQNQGYSSGRYGDGGRPKSGGYDRIRRGGESDLNRPRSSGNRPSSSGWYVRIGNLNFS